MLTHVPLLISLVFFLVGETGSLVRAPEHENELSHGAIPTVPAPSFEIDHSKLANSMRMQLQFVLMCVLFSFSQRLTPLPR